MEIVIDLGAQSTALADRRNMMSFCVRLTGHVVDGELSDRLDALLRHRNIGRVENHYAFIAPEAIRSMAEGDDSWEAEFQAMLLYAASKNWLANDGAIRAHVERSTN